MPFRMRLAKLLKVAILYVRVRSLREAQLVDRNIRFTWSGAESSPSAYGPKGDVR